MMPALTSPENDLGTGGERPMSKMKVILKTSAICSDPAIGRLQYAFIENGLAAADAETFRQHMLRCGACAVAVTNAKTMAAVSRELGLSVDDPRVAASLPIVKIAQPPCSNVADMAARFMKLRK